jgi:hypothetical protein
VIVENRPKVWGCGVGLNNRKSKIHARTIACWMTDDCNVKGVQLDMLPTRRVKRQEYLSFRVTRTDLL